MFHRKFRARVDRGSKFTYKDTNTQIQTHTSENTKCSTVNSEPGWIVVLSKDIKGASSQCFLMQPRATRDPPLLRRSSKYKTRRWERKNKKDSFKLKLPKDNFGILLSLFMGLRKSKLPTRHRKCLCRQKPPTTQIKTIRLCNLLHADGDRGPFSETVSIAPPLLPRYLLIPFDPIREGWTSVNTNDLKRGQRQGLPCTTTIHMAGVELWI